MKKNLKKNCKYWKYYVVKLMSWIVGGFPVSIKYEGDKGKYQVHSTSYPHYYPYKEEIVINWDTKENALKPTKHT